MLLPWVRKKLLSDPHRLNEPADPVGRNHETSRSHLPPDLLGLNLLHPSHALHLGRNLAFASARKLCLHALMLLKTGCVPNHAAHPQHQGFPPPDQPVYNRTPTAQSRTRTSKEGDPVSSRLVPLQPAPGRPVHARGTAPAPCVLFLFTPRCEAGRVSWTPFLRLIFFLRRILLFRRILSCRWVLSFPRVLWRIRSCVLFTSIPSPHGAEVNSRPFFS